MKPQARSTLFERQLRAEVRQIVQLLERTRRTRQQARLLVALETGAIRRRAKPVRRILWPDA
ncbi:MAG TPA: hypothetical protein VKR61_08325 [Bryobacteraceae bacterium]|nr:hypothetical protein [Bryobacteraceae bacterium]